MLREAHRFNESDERIMGKRVCVTLNEIYLHHSRAMFS
jgi:hypothetical protein